MTKIIEHMKARRTIGLLALLLLSFVLAACGGGDGGGTQSSTSGGTTASSGSAPASKPAQAPATDGVVVKMSNYSYDPGEIRVKVGEKVTFVNEDHLAHDIVQTTPDEVLFGDDWGFESPQVMPDGEWTTTFDEPGRYPILCTVESHYLLGMTGEIIVEE